MAHHVEGGYPGSSTKPTKGHNLSIEFNNTPVATRSSISVLQMLGKSFVLETL